MRNGISYLNKISIDRLKDGMADLDLIAKDIDTATNYLIRLFNDDRNLDPDDLFNLGILVGRLDKAKALVEAAADTVGDEVLYSPLPGHDDR